MQVISNDPTIGLKHPFPSQIQLALIFSVRMSWGAYRSNAAEIQTSLKKYEISTSHMHCVRFCCRGNAWVVQLVSAVLSLGYENEVADFRQNLDFFWLQSVSSTRLRNRRQQSIDYFDFFTSTRLKAPGKFHPRSSCSIMKFIISRVHKRMFPLAMKTK